MPRQSASGQILVLVLLVVLIGMSIGLSIASRTLTTFKDTSSLNQSNRAFSAAEAGIENALQRITSGLDCNSNACDLTSAQISGVEAVEVNTSSLGGNTNALVNRDLARDAVLQANLDGYPSNGSVRVYWGKDAQTSDNCDSNGINDSAVVISVVYLITQGTGANSYNMAKFAYDPCPSFRQGGNNNFTNVASDNPGSTPVVTQDGSITDFRAMKEIALTTANLSVPTGVTGISVKLIRARLMYGQDADQVAIAPVGSGVNLPSQGVQITSTAKTGNIQRTVKVLRQNNVLPAIFDYALFNGSTSNTMFK